jgi:hypothetical protein
MMIFWLNSRVDCLVETNVLEKRAVSIFKVEEPTRRFNPKQHHQNYHRRKNLKSHASLCLITVAVEELHASGSQQNRTALQHEQRAQTSEDSSELTGWQSWPCCTCD